MRVLEAFGLSFLELRIRVSQPAKQMKFISVSLNSLAVGKKHLGLCHARDKFRGVRLRFVMTLGCRV